MRGDTSPLPTTPIRLGHTVFRVPHEWSCGPHEENVDGYDSSLRPLDFVCACILALGALLASASPAHSAPSTGPGDPLDPHTYAPESKLFLAVHATGVQKYTCQASGTWVFTDPEAALSKASGAGKPIGSHFLNVATGRPVWEAKDGSAVEAARTASAPAGTGNIPALLLQAVVTTAGSDGDRLAGTTWVQRLNTAGGVAPAGTCAPGSTVAVPYGADYFFWKALGADESDD